MFHINQNLQPDPLRRFVYMFIVMKWHFKKLHNNITVTQNTTGIF